MLGYDEFMAFSVDDFLATVDTWDKVGGDAADHADTLSSEIKSKISADFWSGAAAEAAREMYQDLKTKFDGAEDSAHGIADLVQEIGDRWKKYQGNLKDIVAELEGESLVFDGNDVYLKGLGGAGSTAAVDAQDQQIEQWEKDTGKKYDKTCTDYLERIADELDNADEADGDLQIVLERSFDAEKDSKDESFPEDPKVDPEVVEAEYTAEIIEDGDPSDEDVAKVQQMLDENGSSKAFSTTLFDEVQAEELGDWTAKVAGTKGVSDDELANLQESLGRSLAKATSSDSELAENWAKQAVDYGHTGQDYEVDGKTVNMLGYSTLGPILVHGDYPEDFLLPVVNDMTEVQYGPVGQFDNGDYAYRNLDDGYPTTNPFDPTHSKWVDPLDYGLTALGKNPEESLAYFNQDLTFEDSTGKERKVLDMMMDDVTNTGDVNRGPLGAALESATTGLPYDAPAGTEPVEHTEDMAKLAGEVVGYYGGGDEDERMRDMKGMEDHLADITANYINDFHGTLTESGDGYANKYCPPFGAGIELSDDDARKFLERLGHDKGAYETISSSSLGAAQAEIALAGAEDGDPISVAAATGPHTAVMGFLDHAAAEEIEAKRWDDIPIPGSSPTGQDIADASIRGVMGAIPYAGGASAEAYNLAAAYLREDTSNGAVQDFINAQETTNETLRDLKFEGTESLKDSLKTAIVSACNGDIDSLEYINQHIAQNYDRLS